MTIAMEDFAARTGPRYRALADGLEAAIRDERLRPGDRLPPQRDLAHQLDVTVGTVGRAYALLLQRGLVRGEVGRGTYVLEPGREASPALSQPAETAARQHDLAVNRPVAVPAHAHVFRVLRSMADDGAALAALLTYPPYAGLARHRQALVRWLASFTGDRFEADHVLPVQGAQNGMAVALAAVARPGDTVLMEGLAYPSNHGLASRLGLKLETIVMDDEGAMPDSMAAQCRQHRPTAVILSLDLHNPTLTTASLPRRQAIVDIARRHDLQIIEDAVYAPVAGTGLPLLQSLAPERTLLVCSTSKFLAPGLRFGCVVAPPERLARAVAAQAQLAIGVAPLIAETFARLEAEGVIDEALGQQRAALARRRAVALAALAGLAVTSRENALHVLLDLPDGQDEPSAVLRLAAAGIRTTPLAAFAVGRTQARAALRLSLGGLPDEASLARCLERLRDLLVSERTAPPVI